MKKILCVLGVMLIPIVMTGCGINMGVNTNSIAGRGASVSSTVEMNMPITEIRVDRVSAVLNISNEHSNLEYEMRENLVDYVNISLVNGILRIESTERTRSVGRNNEVIINVGTDVLERLVLAGDARVVGDGTFVSNTLHIDVAGATNVDLDIEVDSVFAILAGAGSLNLSGIARNSSISIAGAANVRARNLITEDTTIDVAGAASVEIFASNTLDVSAAGASTVTYFGNPSVSRSLVGASRIRSGE
ncbi:MAG: DUF2807 domain-containing protein [Defluviitaleaceae bacterium]|nr:DUF2807 domain-containing protein [Defluviitaleaceae bacterium]